MANQAGKITNHPSSINQGRRPFSVTLLALAVLIFAVVHLIRLASAVWQWDFLMNWEGVSAPYLALSGLGWALAGLPLAWGLWRGKPWAPFAARTAFLAYLLYAWIDRIFLANPEITMGADSAWPFMAWASAISLLLVYWILSRSKAKAFYRRDS
jgi:hypothetical protein